MKKILFIAALFVFAIWGAGLYVFHNRIYNNSHYDIETKTDAIIVLTGGKNRIPVGTELLNNNLAENMFISGVSKDVSIEEIMQRKDVSLESKKNIEIGQNATNTATNAKEVDDWLKDNDIHSIRLVTSNYHMPRSVEEISAINKDIEIVEHPVYSENIPPKWWKNKNSFFFIIMEYNKFLYAYSKNKINNFIKKEEK